MMIYTTDTADKVARDASPEAAIWIRELAKQRDRLREALKDSMRYFDQVIAETGYQSEGERITHEKARAALEEIDNG